MNINQSIQSPNFQAKFLHSESMVNIAEFAVKYNTFDKLNRMRKKISSHNLVARLKVDVNVSQEGYPSVTFTKLYPKRGIFFPKFLDDYKVMKTVTYKSEHKDNPFWYAMNKIIEMGKHAPHNNIFQEVMVKK